MKWTVLYQTEGPFEEIIEQLKRHGFSPQVFCDPYCRELYIPGLQKGSIKYPQRFYIAVSQDPRLDAESIIENYICNIEQERANE